MSRRSSAPEAVADVATGAEDARRVCRVAGVRLPVSLESARLAREFVRHALIIWGVPGRGDDAELIVSELVANAVTHTSGADTGEGAVVEVRLRLCDACLRVEVWDAGDGEPGIPGRSDDAEAESGRGLFLVEALSRRWGSRLMTDHGKVVWAELPCPETLLPMTPPVDGLMRARTPVKRG
ncbi:ATP-binding protein [Streptomyces montanisoli]|uniref:ATP-binding protein n=1 Tax=Streptomyces montanisoli TaxID=2798581 RepID=A0A940M962_9ACTN|nr:ATP-binding protein [Streptomyces montanisoli]MBP0456658.1 ATP-binding protein [Streptomyces montanisoli]